jgi:hypothetical protein
MAGPRRTGNTDHVLDWSQILYGAALSGLAAGVLALIVTRDRGAALVAVVAGFAAPVAWNAILRTTHAKEFFTDAPVRVLPASWQDTGSGVFTIALVTLLLGFGPLAAGTGRRIAAVALLAGLAAFAVDVYLY